MLIRLTLDRCGLDSPRSIRRELRAVYRRATGCRPDAASRVYRIWLEEIRIATSGRGARKMLDRRQLALFG